MGHHRVYSSNAEDSIGTSSVLSFYQINDSGYKEIFRYDADEHLVGIFQDRDSRGNLIVIWMAGSGYTFTIFSYINHNVLVVLEDESKMLPEFVYEDYIGRYDILVNRVDWMVDEKTGKHSLVPDSTAIYSWNDNHYNKVIVAWNKRFSSVLKKR
jgi:hypothetical protein